MVVKFDLNLLNRSAGICPKCLTSSTQLKMNSVDDFNKYFNNKIFNIKANNLEKSPAYDKFAKSEDSFDDFLAAFDKFWKKA